MNELISMLLSYVTILLTVIGVLAFGTSVITQITKTWGVLKKIPTDIQVYVVSLILTVLTVTVYIQYSQMQMVWYYIVGAIILSFFVSLVARSGWSDLKTIWNRCNSKTNL